MIYTGMDEDEFEHVETLAKVVAPFKLVARAMSMPAWMLACLRDFLPTNHTLAPADMRADMRANVRACVPACLTVCAPICMCGHLLESMGSRTHAYRQHDA
jgi:hypothetical protein